MAARVDATGGLTLAAGETWNTAMLVLVDGVAQDLAGREFRLSLYSQAAGLQIAFADGVAGEFGDRPVQFFAVTGAMTAAAYAAPGRLPRRALVAERVAGGWTTIWNKRLTITPAPIIPAGDGEDGGAITQLTGSEDDGEIEVIEVDLVGRPGVRGATAAEQLFVAGTIDAPTTEAMIAWFATLGGGDSGDDPWYQFTTTGPILAGEKLAPDLRDYPVTFSGLFRKAIDAPADGPYVFTITDNGEPIGSVDWSFGVTSPDVAFLTGMASRPAGAPVRLEAPGYEDDSLRGPCVWLHAYRTPD